MGLNPLRIKSINVYKVLVTYKEPITAQVAVLARDENHVLEKLKQYINYEDMPPELDFKVSSIELIEEDVPVDEDEIEEAYISAKGADDHRSNIPNKNNKKVLN